jgi:hypothetical protein
MMTAVEWLINEMPVIDWQDPYWKIKSEKAKEMFEKQIIDARQSGIDAALKGRSISNLDYYNETFKQQA